MRAPILFAVAMTATACKDRPPDAVGPSPSSVPLAPPPPVVAVASASASSSLECARLPSFAPVVKKVDPSVVTVLALVAPGEAGASRAGRPRSGKGLGTGFVVDRDGVILTNAHVVEHGKITVRLSDERELEAVVVGRDARTDIAVLKVDAHELTPAILGDSDAVEIGDWVVAIGNPFGLAHTVSTGIVSAKGRTQEDVPLDPAGFYDFLQTDASINPGNSGGPLVDLTGRVVAMNTAIRGGGAQGIGFAIPINMVKQLLPKLLRDGRIVRSALGVRIRDLQKVPREERTRLALGPEARGALVDSVDPGGPAADSGLQAGDLVVRFQDEAIVRSAHLQWLASTAGVGQIVTLGVLRGATPREVKVRLGELVEPKEHRAPELPAGPPRP